MTDHPRFIPFKGNPDEAHRHYHGAALVDWVLKTADMLYRAPRSGETPRAEHPAIMVPARSARSRVAAAGVFALVTFVIAIVVLGALS